MSKAKGLLKILEAAQFITDFGEPMEATDIKTGKRLPKYDVKRYLVWSGGAKPKVIDSSNDLDILQKKYGPDLTVTSLKK